jgi:undecaprenyl phosphate-alpha-L-ara4FN deformylase
MRIGLRVDVDTFRGTRYGVPNLCALLADHSIKASFFFSVGPDNMGRHLWRLIRPAFLRKMLRTRASHLYGWNILLRGTLWPGPVIGERLQHVIRATADEGHEVGFHAWDHHAWQAHIDTMDSPAIHRYLSRGVELLERIVGCAVTCSAAPAWKCNDLVLMEKSKFSFRYNSDCRGESIFNPVVQGEELSQPQIPVTLPTYDEVIGQNGVSDSNFDDYMLSLLEPRSLNVLTVHAEVEGIASVAVFRSFVKMALSRGASFSPLGVLLEDSPQVGRGTLVARKISGRADWVSYQAPAESKRNNSD